jgi:ribosomal protein S18 acetylase RimI-like enzyme
LGKGLKPNLKIRQVTFDDLDPCFLIESACYGPEGATRERIEKRIKLYPEGFLVAELEGRIVGFVNSGATHQADLSDEALKDLVGHEPDGQNLVIFSLAVQPKYQGQGISKELMRHFIETARQLKKATILLMCRPELVVYYQQYGFIYRGASKSTHGGLQWQEMYLPL